MKFTVAASSTIEALANSFESVLGTLIGRRKVGCVADFPNHSNVGDSAIYLGELAALKRLGIWWRSVAVFDFVDASGGMGQTPVDCECILIHGGGNFGDLYPDHQELRLKIIRSNRNTRVIQLPQSLSFFSKQSLRRTAAVINNHPDFHLMVRDHESEATAREFFSCSIYLVPDAAFSLRSLPRLPCRSRLNHLGILRTDKERVESVKPEAAAANIPFDSIEDWLVEDQTWLHLVDRRLKVLLIRHPSLQFNWLIIRLRAWLYAELAKVRLARGVAQLSRADFVTTDRLHGHIMCTLMGIKHVALDNSTGKVSAFRSTWNT